MYSKAAEMEQGAALLPSLSVFSQRSCDLGTFVTSKKRVFSSRCSFASLCGFFFLFPWYLLVVCLSRETISYPGVHVS